MNLLQSSLFWQRLHWCSLCLVCGMNGDFPGKMVVERICLECGTPFKVIKRQRNAQVFCTPKCRIRCASRRKYQRTKGQTREIKVRTLRGPRHSFVGKSKVGDGVQWRPRGNDRTYLVALRASGGRW